MAKGIMKLIDRVKKPVIGGLIGSMLMSYSPKISNAEWRKEGQITEREYVGTSEGYTEEYNLDLSKSKFSESSNILKIPLIKSKYVVSYDEYSLNTYDKYVEYKKENEVVDPVIDTLGTILTGGMLYCLIAGYAKENKQLINSGWYCLGGTGLLYAVGMEEVDKPTGESSRKFVESETIIDNEEKKFHAENKPSLDTLVNVDTNHYFFEEGMYITDEQGYLNLKLGDGSLNFKDKKALVHYVKNSLSCDLSENKDENYLELEVQDKSFGNGRIVKNSFGRVREEPSHINESNTSNSENSKESKTSNHENSIESLLEESVNESLSEYSPKHNSGNNVKIILGDEYLGQKRYAVNFTYDEKNPEEVEIESIFEGTNEANVGRGTMKKLAFSASLINYLRNHSYSSRRIDELMRNRAEQYSNKASSLLNDSNFAGSIEMLGRRAGYNLATGQKLDGILKETAKDYAVMTVKDMVKVYSIGAETSTDKTMSEILETFAGIWLSRENDPKNFEEAFIEDLRASFLAQSVTGSRYLKEASGTLNEKNFFRDFTNFKDIQKFYTKFKDGWTKGGVLEGWEKLEEENFDRKIGKAIGYTLAGKFAPSAAFRGASLINRIGSFAKSFESEEDRMAKRQKKLKEFLKEEKIKEIFDIIRIEMEEDESFFDNFEKYRDFSIQ